MAELSGLELDYAIAERVMKWQCPPGYNYWMTIRGNGDFDLHALKSKWSPSTDANLLPAVLAKVEAAGRVKQFCEALFDARPIGFPKDHHHGDMLFVCWPFWLLAHCPLSTKLNAALSALSTPAGAKEEVDGGK